MLVYGKNVALSYLESSQVNKVYLLKGFNDQKIINFIKNKKIGWVSYTKNDLDKLVNGNHQGIILDVNPKKQISLEHLINELPNKIVMLDHIEDPHNFGAIIRTCEAAGIKNIIIPNKRSVSGDGIANKTSAGTLNKVNIITVSNLRDAVIKLKKHHYWVVGTDMEADHSYAKFDYPEKLVLIIGNEGKGISPLLKKECDYTINIPMLGEVNSLNASVAAAIIIFESIKE